MFFKVEGSLWILIDSQPKPNSKIKGRCTILANFHHTCTHNPTCSALIIFKINFYLWLFSFFLGTRSIHLQHKKLFSSAQQPSSSSMNIHFWLSKSLSSRTNPLLISYKPVVKKLSSSRQKEHCHCQLIKNLNARWSMFEKVRRRTTKNFKLIPQEPQSRAFQPSPEYTILFLVKIRNWAAVPK